MNPLEKALSDGYNLRTEFSDKWTAILFDNERTICRGVAIEVADALSIMVDNFYYLSTLEDPLEEWFQ